MIVLFTFGFVAQAQDRGELEKKRTYVLKQIKVTENFLSNTTQKRENNLDDLRALESQIIYRERLISLIKEEVNTIEREIRTKQERFTELDLQYNKLLEKYGDLLQWAFVKKQSENQWINILSAKSLNDSFIRWRYFNQLKKYLVRQANTLKQLKEELAEILVLIELQKSGKERLLLTETSHFETLQLEREIKDELQTELANEEEKFKEELITQRKYKDHLSKAIEKIIADEIAASERAAKNAALDPELIELSSSFNQNKGMLPWPVHEAIIAQRFGNQRHPSLKNVTISNNGLDIRSKKNAEVYAIFKGEVVGNLVIPGHDHMIMIKHGNYYTVYSRLAEIYISNGDNVETNQLIGRLSLNEHENSILHFELWEGKAKVNPELWLNKN